MFTKKLKICSIAIVGVLICSTSVYSQSITHSNFSNETSIGIGPNASMVFFLEGSDLFPYDSLELSVVTLPQDTFSGIVSPPPIVNISGLGIFSGASTVFTPANLSASSHAKVSFSIPNSAIPTEGAPIAEVFFDTTGLSDGDVFAYGPNATLIDGDALLETVNVLTFFATVEAVPEPSSAGFLFALGSVFMMRRKRV